ncbi:MAG: hypothetical protein H0W01_02535 [Pseudonocardiales bacterium]|nr:hypothetical protein [Pseudonocardiales bacterium]
MLRVRSASGALPVIVSALVAAGLLTGAAVAVQSAGCDDPGRYVLRQGGYELVGGCLEPGDLPVPPQTQTPAPGTDAAIRN